ncbi:ATP-grasp domain-containing protein [Paenibacillus agricola]|uniref:ATP-grasp domain-containing protein n=1 Tax=Paenibacillus agricola TaxID=2716264 RepID=A0ABX0J3F1_9BACL|nr:ATP-grasp domain-containing protein [Paenibacillus agricola]NHN28646.1 ATP-grasp domain-containing protein [Paenibacillus agricola]
MSIDKIAHAVIEQAGEQTVMKTAHQPTLHILLTGGRAPITLELARMLAKAGHRIDLAESVPHHLCRQSRSVAQSHQVPAPNKDPEPYIAALVDIIQKRHIHMLIPTCEEILWIARGLPQLDRLCKVVAAPLEQLKKLHSKWDFIKQAEAYGLAIPYTQAIHNEEDWRAIVGEEHALLLDGYVLKPAFSRFAENVQLFGPTVALNERLKGLNPLHSPQATPERPWIIQQYISGRPLCTYSVAFQGVVVAHTAYEVRYTANRGACVYFQPLDHPELMAWVRTFVEKEHFSGQIAFDFIESAQDRTLYPLECNPRATSGIHLFSEGDGLEQALLAPEVLVAAGDCIQPHSGKASMLSLAMLGFGLKEATSWRGFSRFWQHFVKARDVIWKYNDPLPFFEQIPQLLDTWRVSKAQRISLTAAMTYDIEWNGEP